MIAVVKVGGHQALVTKGEKIEIDKVDAEVGSTIDLQVFLTSNEDGTEFNMGTPFLEKVTVKAKVLEHGRGKKNSCV